MSATQICIQYKPQIYADCFERILLSLRVGQVRKFSTGSHPQDADMDQPDLIVVSLGANGKPENTPILERWPDARVIAFSTYGDVGWRRASGAHEWEVVRPFGLRQLIDEAVAIAI